MSSHSKVSKKTTLIRGGRLIDASQNFDRVGNVLLRDGKVAEFNCDDVSADETIDATGLIVCPGFIDPHVSLREPGFEEDETTITGTAAALAGGYTTIAAMPNTNPVVDNRAAAEFILLQAARANNCHVLPLGAVTRSHEGAELADIGQLVEGGAVGFTDADHTIANAEVMRRALEYTGMFDRPIFTMPSVPEMAADGVMHEGFHSTELGLRGIPPAAQDIMVGRDIALAEMTRGRIHLMCLSTIDAVDRVRRAKHRNVHVTADVTPHHLLFLDEELRAFDPNFKVAPPLRTQKHVDALIAGLQDGTLDVISADHQPLSEEKKNCEIDLAPTGVIGLETMLPACVRALIEPGHLTWLQFIEKLTVGPARVLGLQEKGSLAVGSVADVTLLDPEERWTIRASEFRSKSRNTPFDGWSAVGRVMKVLVNGEVRFDQVSSAQAAH